MGFLQILSAIFSPRSTFNKTFDATETYNDLDGSKHFTWRAVRRQNLNKLTRDIFWIVICLVVVQGAGTDQYLLRAENVAKNEAADVRLVYGIVYQIAIFALWALTLLISLVFAVLWFPIFRWLNVNPSSSKTVETVTDSDGITRAIVSESPDHAATDRMGLINEYAYTVYAYGCACRFVWDLYRTIQHIGPATGSTPSTETRFADRRKARNARLQLVAGMVLSLALDAAIMYYWFLLGIIRFTTQEYAIIVVPVQLTVGITFASILQAWYEEDEELPTGRDRFEKGSDGNLTLEGMRQAVCFLVHAQTDVTILAKMAAVHEEEREKKKREKLESEKEEKQADGVADAVEQGEVPSSVEEKLIDT